MTNPFDVLSRGLPGYLGETSQAFVNLDLSRRLFISLMQRYEPGRVTTDEIREAAKLALNAAIIFNDESKK